LCLLACLPGRKEGERWKNNDLRRGRLSAVNIEDMKEASYRALGRDVKSNVS